MVDALKQIMSEEMDDAWSWDDLAKAIVERHGTSEATEIIQCLIMNEPDILHDVCLWQNVQDTVISGLQEET